MKSLVALLLITAIPLIPILIGVVFLFDEIRGVQQTVHDGLQIFEGFEKKAWEDLQIMTISWGTREKRSKIATKRRRQRKDSEDYPISVSAAFQPTSPEKLEDCPAGAPGPAGKPGQPGEPGSDGVPGKNWFEVEVLAFSSIDSTCILCPAGPPGLPGHDGLPGLQGENGRPGPNGQPGLNGLMGPMGEQGKHGADGYTGTDGIIGRPGDSIMRLVGTRGPPGPKGPTGLPGLKGQDGFTFTGQNGPDGVVGLPGNNGKPGNRGAPGVVSQTWGNWNRRSILFLSTANSRSLRANRK